jgi:hypothetical protein
LISGLSPLVGERQYTYRREVFLAHLARLTWDDLPTDATKLEDASYMGIASEIQSHQ